MFRLVWLGCSSDQFETESSGTKRERKGRLGVVEREVLLPLFFQQNDNPAEIDVNSTEGDRCVLRLNSHR